MNLHPSESTPLNFYILPIEIRIGRFPVQTPLGAWLGLGTQLRYKVPGNLWVKIVEKAAINIELVRLSPQEWSKVGCGTAK